MKRHGGTIWRLRDGDAAMVVSPRWRDEPPRSRASTWRERLGWVAAISLLLHAAFVALAFLTPAPPPPAISDETPPGEVALVFQGGSNTAPASPTPSQETSVGPPSPDRALEAPPAGAPPPPDSAAAPAASSVLPPVAQTVPPPAESVPQSGGAPQVAMLPAPSLVPQAETPQPQTTRAPPPPLPPLHAEPHSAPHPVPSRPRIATPRPDAFPKPLNFAFNGSILDGHGTTGRALPHESMGPVQPGPSSRSAFNSDINGNIGPDYRNLLRAWLERHKYYPQQAIEQGEDGTASVRVMVRKDGSVRMVELDERSGSQWLDMGAQALFRGQRLPPFPSDAMGDEQEIEVTIHYILIRG